MGQKQHRARGKRMLRGEGRRKAPPRVTCREPPSPEAGTTPLLCTHTRAPRPGAATPAVWLRLVKKGRGVNVQSKMEFKMRKANCFACYQVTSTP